MRNIKKKHIHLAVEASFLIDGIQYKDSFYIDTGFTYEILTDVSKVSLKNIRQKPRKMELKMADGHIQKFLVVTADEVEIEGMVFRKVPVYLGKKVPTLIGMGLLSRMKFMFDGPKGELILYPS